MVSVLALSVVDHEFEPRSGPTIDSEIGICCFFAKHITKTDWLTRISLTCQSTATCEPADCLLK